MNNLAIKKHEIYNSIEKLDEASLNSVADFVSYVKNKDKKFKNKTIQLRGILKDYPINLYHLNDLRKKSWDHLESKFDNE